MPSKLKGNHGVAAALIIAGALLLRAPGLVSELHSDDYVQAAMLDGAFPAPRSLFALYDFGGRDERDRARLRESGWFPWWSSPELKIAMFRPLSSALIAVDDTLARRSPGLRHAHSALWLVLLLSGAAALLRVVMPAGLALLALCLLAVDPSLSIPLSWLANRAALVAGALGVWGCYVYLRWRRGELQRAGAPVASACFALAVLAGESGWAFAAYPIARECVDAGASAGARARSLAIALGPAIVVLAAASGLGFGVAGSGLYVSPLADPIRYLDACFERIPPLAGELVWALPAGDPALPADLRALLGLLALAALALGARSTWQAMSTDLRALLLGSVLALPLVAGALPEARLLLASAVGFAAAVVFGLARVLPSARAIGSGRRRALGWALLAALCAVMAVRPVRAVSAAAELAAKARTHRRWALGAELDRAAAPGQHWFVISAKDYTTLSILPFLRRFEGHAMPRAYRVLSTAPHAHELRRIDLHTLELTALGSDVEGRYAGSLFRPRSQPLRAGDEVAVGGVRARVLRAYRGNPVRVEFRFERPADHPSHVFLQPERAGLRRVTIPEVGARMRLAAPRAPRSRRPLLL